MCSKQVWIPQKQILNSLSVTCCKSSNKTFVQIFKVTRKSFNMINMTVIFIHAVNSWHCCQKRTFVYNLCLLRWIQMSTRATLFSWIIDLMVRYRPFELFLNTDGLALQKVIIFLHGGIATFSDSVTLQHSKFFFQKKFNMFPLQSLTHYKHQQDINCW